MGHFQMLVGADVFRGNYRNSIEKPKPFISDEVTEIKYDLRDKCHTFQKGHRIMVQVQSTWFPLIDRNPQKFLDIYHAKESDFQKAVHKVYRSSSHSSHLKLRILQ
jgi:predicted acyl esterase